MPRVLQLFVWVFLLFIMVQSEFVLPPIISNSKRKSILNLASSKSTVHKPGTLPPSLFTLRKHKQKNSTGLQYGANASCNPSLYQVKGSSGQTAGELGAPAANGEHQKVLLPPPSLSSLPPLVVHMSEHSATAGGKMDSLQPCFSVDTKDSKASGGGRAGENGSLFAVGRDKIHVAREHRINIPNNKFVVHKRSGSTRTSGIPASSKISTNFSSTEPITHHSNGDRAQAKSYSSRSVPNSSQLKLDLPSDIHKYQTGADICSIINLRMPLPSTLRTANGPEEFVPSEAQPRSNGNKKNGMTGAAGNGPEVKSEWEKKRKEVKSRKAAKARQLDQFNSALIQLKQVVSDSVCNGDSAGNLPGSTDVFGKKKKNRENTCRLNIVDLEKQAALINDSFLTTPTHHQNATATLGGGGGPSTAIAAAGGGNLQNREQSGSEHSSSSDADTHISEDPSHHSVHILHRISLPANDDAMDGQPPNKRNIFNLYARTNGAAGGKSVETQCWNQLPTTPFAYYHFMRRNNANSCGVMRIMPSASPAPSPLPHDPVPLHHSLQSDLTIEGNCNSNINNNNNNNNSNGCTADLQHDAKGKDGALPSLSPGLKSLKVSALKLAPRSPPMSANPSLSQRRYKQSQTSGASISLEEDKKDGKFLYADPLVGACSRFQWKLNRLQDREHLTIRKEGKIHRK